MEQVVVRAATAELKASSTEGGSGNTNDRLDDQLPLHASSQKIDPDSFKGKVLLSAIDKLVLGLAAGAILFAFQQRSENDQKIRDDQRRVSQVYTTFITDQRDHVVNTMQLYFSKVSRILPYAGKTIGELEKKSEQELRQYADELNIAFFTVGTVSDRIESASGPLETAVLRLNLYLTETRDPNQTADVLLGSVRQHYRDVLVVFREEMSRAAYLDASQ